MRYSIVVAAIAGQWPTRLLPMSTGLYVCCETDANETAREAAYRVAKVKCDVFAGEVKDDCIDQAKAEFAQY
jgi:hypothetical protein